MFEMLRDAFTTHDSVERGCRVPNETNLDDSDEPNKDAQTFFKYLKEAQTPLYPGSTKSTKLSFLVRLLHAKCINGWSNKSFDMLLEILRDSLPDDINIPKNYYDAKKLLRDLGMDCIKIDACPNDCMLYWKDENMNKEGCDICGESRWKPETCHEGESVSLKKPKKKAAKILRYFPLKPRLQRLYMCSRTSKAMRWNSEGRTKDGNLRHPGDTKVWEVLNNKYPWFAADPRNVRLGLASDGFNPFGIMSSTHSTWLVVLVPYNLPPWLCLKQTHFILSMLIPGPTGPGNDIDVYLQPLIKELKELWYSGIETYDADLRKKFQMHAAILWTINDFPALANLSGWSTKGFLACPSCNKDTCSIRLHHGNKCVYLAHRMYLPPDHMFRENTNPVRGSVGYYGVLNDVVELKYINGNPIVLFKCHWWDVISRRGIKQDEYGFTSLNFNRTLGTNEPFVLATQAQQVVYVQDNLNEDWRVVLRAQPRDLYNMGIQVQPTHADSPYTNKVAAEEVDIAHAIENWSRDEIDGEEVDEIDGDEIGEEVDEIDGDEVDEIDGEEVDEIDEDETDELLRNL